MGVNTSVNSYNSKYNKEIKRINDSLRTHNNQLILIKENAKTEKSGTNNNLVRFKASLNNLESKHNEVSREVGDLKIDVDGVKEAHDQLKQAKNRINTLTSSISKNSADSRSIEI